MNHILGIFSGTVHLGLVTVIHMDAEAFHCLLELIFKMLCVVGAAVIIGIGHVHIRIADILIPGLLSLRSGNLGHVYRDFAEPVEFIPGKKKPRFLSLASQCLYHKIACRNISEIPDMNGAGRTDSGGAYIFFLIRAAPDNFLCNSV